jgi:maleylacetoacetate isomerase
VAVKLYDFHSSSTSFRVRIALNIKGVDVEHVPLDIGDFEKPDFRDLNPYAGVPVLIDGGVELVQSMAIIEYLEETRPEPALLPKNLDERARVRALSLWIACEIQPLNTVRTLRYLKERHQVDEQALGDWQLNWCQVGFDALEQQLAKSSYTGKFCHGETPTMADCFLVPQIYNSQRPLVGADLGKWPTLSRIYENCMSLPEFERALPQNQPGFGDAPMSSPL